jgi:lipoyl(octanoyl) transferase
MQDRTVKFRDLGIVDYKATWDYQTRIFEEIIAIKVRNRETGETENTENFLVFCEHPHVYTLGKTGKKENLLINNTQLSERNASYYEINRGGDITYHGPGQLVVYPILDLDNFFTDIHKYMRFLEEIVIRTCNDFGIQANRVSGLTGVWLGDNESDYRKICAMGVKTSRWVTMHGLAFNINTDLDFFKNIVPCGISDKAVTSMKNELGAKQDLELVKNRIKSHFQEVFECDIIND